MQSTNEEPQQGNTPRIVWWLTIPSFIMPVAMIFLLVKSDGQRKAHYKRREAFAERQAIAEEKRLEESRARWAEQENREAERQARIDAKVPDVDDQSIYASAYRLLHPEDDERERCEIAVRLLTRNRDLKDIPPRELDLLYRAYNYLSKHDKAFEVFETLWENAPGTYYAVSNMQNALHNKHMFSGSRDEIIRFVDRELGRENGANRELLMLKASTLAYEADGDPTAEQKRQVTALLMEAVKYQAVRNPAERDYWYEDSHLWQLASDPYASFYSGSERKELAAKLQKADIAGFDRSRIVVGPMVEPE